MEDWKAALGQAMRDLKQSKIKHPEANKGRGIAESAPVKIKTSQKQSQTSGVTSGVTGGGIKCSLACKAGPHTSLRSPTKLYSGEQS
jgi:hypothetical protein